MNFFMLKGILNFYKSSFSGLPRDAWLLSLVVLINRSGTMVLFFMTLYVTKELGFSVLEAGRLISIYGVGSLVGALLGGWLTDKIGTNKVQGFSLLLSGIGFILLGYVESIAGISIFLFVLATFNESFRPANSTAIAAVCKPELRTRAFGLNRLAINLGVTIGPSIGGILATISYAYLFWVDGLTCIIAAIFLWLVLSEPASDDLSESFNKKSSASPWKDVPFLITLFFLLMIGLIFVQLFNTWPLYLRDLAGLIESQIGLLMGLNAFLVVLIEMPVIKKIETQNHLRIMAIGSLLLFGGFAILPLSAAFIFIAFSVVVWTLGEILVFPLVASFIANRATDQNRGQYMGMFTFSFALSLVIAPVLGTYIYERFGPDNLWYFFGVVGVGVTLGFLLLSKHLNKIKNN
jgi:MFS family permease